MIGGYIPIQILYNKQSVHIHTNEGDYKLSFSNLLSQAVPSPVREHWAQNLMHKSKQHCILNAVLLTQAHLIKGRIECSRLQGRVFDEILQRVRLLHEVHEHRSMICTMCSEIVQGERQVATPQVQSSYD